MQDELNQITTDNGGLQIHILGVNEVNYGNSLSSSQTLPLLQDVSEYEVSINWGAGYRDVWVLNEAQDPYAIVNLTTYTLSDPSNYEGLKNLFLAASLGQSCSSVEHPFDSSICQ